MSGPETKASSRPGVPLRAGPAYWRALNELAESPELERLVGREYPLIASQLSDGATRRSFLKLMAASLALGGMGGLTGCIRWPRENILPFTAQPPGRIPGEPVTYATAFELNGVAHPVVVTSLDGRPIKVDGNALHPQSMGGSSAIDQATVLGLYDPMRSAVVTRRVGAGNVREAHSWESFVETHKHFQKNGGDGLTVLAPPTSSASVAALRAKMPRAKWVEWDPLSRDNETDGARLAFGRSLRARYQLSRAKTILAVDCDFLMTHPESTRLSRDFAGRRRGDDAEKTVCRLRAIEAFHSVTGSNADERYPCRAQDVGAVLAAVADRLMESIGSQWPSGASDVRDAFKGTQAKAMVLEPTDVDVIATDLYKNRGAGAILVGERQPAAVHALAHLLNVALDNVGNDRPVEYLDDRSPPRERNHRADLEALVKNLNDGGVDTLLILDGNPVYDAPADLNFATALAKAKHAIHLSLYMDETAQRCEWHLPAAHYLESWSDCRSWDGQWSVTQPLIEPLYGGRTPAEVLSLLVEEKPRSGHDIVHSVMPGGGGEAGEKTWKRVLHDGVLKGSGFPVARDITPQGGWAPRLTAAIGRAGSGMEVVFIRDYKVFDGRFANNGWMQELPDPMTKLTWDNAAIIGIGYAREMDIVQGDMLAITIAGVTRELPAFLLPGHSNKTVTIALGYGRKLLPPSGGDVKVAGATSYSRYSGRDPSTLHLGEGHVAESVGVNAYELRPVESLEQAAVPAEVRKGSGTYDLATTQKHHPINLHGSRWELGNFTVERTGALVRAQHIDDYRKTPDGIAHYVHMPEPIDSLWEEKKYEGNRWGMAIDLSTCTGCSACVVACQAENNIAVTGKMEVAKGREMHWIRIDRYFVGTDEDDPRVAHQPVTCQQCENAPCEQVCPVAATSHSEEGLNDMAYNRCVGTRYCSNNCPYKVRRFNYFNNFKDVGAVERMVYNPDVTVRGRGVMEKCTFCVQRISAVRISARNAGRAIVDGEITPACAQACPSQAIVFGDLSDATSRVAKLHAEKRAYKMLEELNVKPRNVYLAKLVNTDEVLNLHPHNPVDPEGHGSGHDDPGSGHEDSGGHKGEKHG